MFNWIFSAGSKASEVCTDAGGCCLVSHFGDFSPEDIQAWEYRIPESLRNGPSEELIRDTKYLPLSAGWNHSKNERFNPFPTSPYINIPRSEGYEHIAGPGCRSTDAYSGHRIAAEEMRGCRVMQCLFPKPPDWTLSPDDVDLERDSHHTFTGLGITWPNVLNPELTPHRHRIKRCNHEFDGTIQAYDTDEGKSGYGVVFHPTCFEIFRQAALQSFGEVNIDALVQSILKDPPITHSNDTDALSVKKWIHEPGKEYLGANPVFIPGLHPILEAAIPKEDHFNVNASAFPPKAVFTGGDLFGTLPRETLDAILDYLDSQSIAALRLSSRAFYHIPCSRWRKLIRIEMPWLYEAWSADPRPYYWAFNVGSEVNPELGYMTGRALVINIPWVEALKPESWEAMEMRKLRALSPVRLPTARTNWYQLYLDIVKNWKHLRGLQNRARIWEDVQKLIERIE